MDKDATYAEQHYATVSRLLGHDFPAPETTTNELDHAALQAKPTDEAIALFECNAKAFPDSGNAADSLADGYAQAKRWKDAAPNEQRGVTLSEAEQNLSLDYFRTQLKHYEDVARDTAARHTAER